MKVNPIKIFTYFIVISSAFLFGKFFGYKECKEVYGYDYEYMLLQVDTLQLKSKELKITYDSIKKSPCYKNGKP